MNKYIGPDFIHFTGPAEIDGRILLTFFDEKKIGRGRAMFFTQPATGFNFSHSKLFDTFLLV
jgi:hypothetical protein